MARSLLFYTEILGMQKSTHPPAKDYVIVDFPAEGGAGASGMWIVLTQSSSAPTPTHWDGRHMLVLDDDNLTTVMGRVKEASGRSKKWGKTGILHPLKENFGVVTDPDGFEIALASDAVVKSIKEAS